ncbi:MAG: hypothetical protein KBT46_00870, partial [Ruminococcus sp.]|nr:hypothetical protein [Candidatus Copronaster equi]
TYEISQFSGIFIMLCLGFGMATLFGIMLGRGFSGKQWKIWDFVILIAVFYAFNYLAKATLAHWIVGLVQPQAAQAFEDGLVAAGKDGTAYEMFMKHFDNASWAKKIDGGRNYFAEIQAVASTISAIAVIIATRFIIKDKRAARMGLIVSAAFAFSVTVSDIFFYLSAGGYHMLKESMLPECVHAWSFWEYFTGFFAGGIITAVVINLKPENDVEELVMKKVPEKATNVIAILLGYVFAVGVNIARPIFTRYDDDYPVYYLIAGIVGAVIIAALVILLLKKKFGLEYKKIDMQKFSALMLPFFIVSIFVTYMFIGTRDMWNILELFGGEAIAYWMIFNFVVLSVYTFIKTKQFKELKK